MLFRSQLPVQLLSTGIGVFAGVAGNSSDLDPMMIQMAGSLVSLIFVVPLVIAQLAIRGALQLGVDRMMLAAARGEAVDLGMLFNRMERNMAGGRVGALVGVGVLAGYVCCIFPAFALYIFAIPGMLMAADAELGARDSLRAGYRALQGHGEIGRAHV